ncbi:MAG: calcium-binding protein [Oculatellaceae cyanobacterium bins.114]|nr:calcium-binding protein [Oculatellaceae cyanobacterium bins.114]
MVTVRGDGRNNALSGTQAADTLLGLGGNDSLFGLQGDDLLQGGNGNDRLDGGQGSDRLLGGRGDDTYVVNNPGDTVVEGNRFQGIDTVESFISVSLKRYVEDLILQGRRRLNGTGNELNNFMMGNGANNVLRGLFGDDRLYGMDGNDRLEGGRGKDILDGGIGDDTYSVDDPGDILFEDPNQGTDTVETFINFTLADAFENLTLKGNAVRGTGNSATNTLIGNAANNVINGGAGADNITGNGGNDTLTGGDSRDRDLFFYNTGRAFTRADIGTDTITDFVRRTDAIVLSRQTFGVSNLLTSGDPSQFQAVATDIAAETSAARIVFSQATGTIFLNANGTSSGFGSRNTSGSFLVLSGVNALDARDFVIQP